MLIGRKRERREREIGGWMDRESREVCGMSVKNKGKYEQKRMATRGRKTWKRR
jgi:hypothetical protein